MSAIHKNGAVLAFTYEELCFLQSMFEVLVDGDGTYMMLRLPPLVKLADSLLDRFSEAIGRERERHG